MICIHGYNTDIDVCASCSERYNDFYKENWDIDEYYYDYDDEEFVLEDILVDGYIDFESIAAMEFAPIGEEIEDTLD